MITQETCAAIYAAHREIVAGEKLLEDMKKERERIGFDADKYAPTLRDHFGRVRQLQLGIPSGENAHRLFETSFPVAPPQCRHTERPVIGVYGGHARNRSSKHGGRGTKDVWDGGHKAAASKALGIDWMTLGELSEAIPPAYTEFLGWQLRAAMMLRLAA